MNGVLHLAGRNLRLYARDRLGVFFSLLGPLILLGLYGLFLGRLQTDGLSQTLPQADADDIQTFVTSWVFAGVVMITTLTTGLSAVGAFVEDRASGRFADFRVTPLSRMQLVGGYLLAAFVVAVALSTVVLVIGQVWLLLTAGLFLGWANLAIALGWIALSSACFAALSGFLAGFLSTTGAFSALSTVMGTVLGFLAGAYLPPGLLPAAVLNVMNPLPFSQSAMLIRQPFTEAALEQMTGGQQQAIDAMTEYYGMRLFVGEFEITTPFAVVELAGLLVLFALLGAWRIGRSIR